MSPTLILVVSVRLQMLLKNLKKVLDKLAEVWYVIFMPSLCYMVPVRTNSKQVKQRNRDGILISRRQRGD